jgi:hypothetical protein
MNFLKFTFSLIAIFIITIQSFSQDSLQVKYDALIEKSETFQHYKVIPKTSLDAFWSESVDSLNRAKSKINDLQLKVTSQKDSIRTLNYSTGGIQLRLDESLKVNDSIHFMGIPFSKWVYHIMVWLIIIVLALLGLMGYFMYLRSNRLTSRFKRELEGLTNEFESHKDQAREKQMKLKRELQTAVNQLSERRN